MDLFVWRHTVYNTYGIKSHYLAAVDTSEIVGALALYEIKHLSSHVNFMVVYDGDAPIASSKFYIINDVLVSVQACSLRSYNRKSPNYLLSWSMIQLACKKELMHVDIGRSSVDSNTMAFKRNWNCEFFPLSYNYYLNKGESIPFVHPTNPKYQMVINIWKRLPDQITKVIGPQILKGLG